MTVMQSDILSRTILIVSLALTTACSGPSPTRIDNPNDRLARATERLQQPLVIEGQSTEMWPLEERMQRFSVPGVSVAVIDDFQIAAAGAWGVLEAGRDEAVTTETIFQAGSVSKPVAALLTLALVGDGELHLDQPIDEVLQSWQVPSNEFTDSAPVTLRHVMTHQAGFTPFSYLIRRSDASVPGMAELLRGGIHNWPVVKVEFLPGSKHAYSNAGYCVLQLVLEDVSNLSLHELATRRMFSPLGMDHSTFDEPLSAEILATAASGHRRKRKEEDPDRSPVPVKGKAEIAPGAAGGLWSTPSDLAQLAVEVMQAAHGGSDRLLTPQLAREFLSRQIANVGLGLFIEGDEEALLARHGGSMVGFTAQMVFYPNSGKGAVVMASSEGGRWLNQELVAAIADEYQWPGYPVRRSLGTVTPDQLGELVGVYTLDSSPKTTFTVTLEDEVPIGRINQYPPFELKPTTETDLFVLPRESLEVLFRRADDGTVAKVIIRRAGDAGNFYTRRAD